MIYRSRPEDFKVQEVPLFAPSGSGAHRFFLIRKRGVDSAAVARALASFFGCPPGEVGMAGRKDRYAVTEQWFSVPRRSDEGKKPEEFESFLDGVELLESSFHEHKLRTGQLNGNRFRLVVRDVEDLERLRVDTRANQISLSGFANRYGHQRFGRDGRNPAKGKEILLGAKIQRDRRASRFLVSALQSEVFNRTLSLRQEDIGINRLVSGDLVHVHASGGVFWVDSIEGEQVRADALELSPTGPMMGDKMRRPWGEAARWELAALAELGLRQELFQSRKGLRLYGARRPLRAIAKGLEVMFQDQTAVVTMELSAGAYASVFLEELFGDGLVEGDGRGRLTED